MVKCFWPLKDLNVLAEMLFVTTKVQGQFKAIICRQEIMCLRCQETALQGFLTVNIYGVGPKTPTHVRASRLQCSQF